MTPYGNYSTPVGATSGTVRGGREALKAFDQRTREFARQHPFAAVAAATFLGYLIGRASSR